jgi:hypothetical protein
VYPQAQTTLQIYQSQLAQLDSRLAKEQSAQKRFDRAVKWVAQALEATNNARNFQQYQQAKAQWEDIQTELKTLPSGLLITERVQAQLTQAQDKIQVVQAHIARLIAEAKQPESKTNRSSQVQTAIAQGKPLPVSKPPSQPLVASNPVISNPVISRPNVTKVSPKPQTPVNLGIKVTSPSSIIPLKPQPSNSRSLVSQEQTTSNIYYPTTTNREELSSYANDIAAGLLIAHQNGTVRYGSIRYKQVQSAMRELRRGKSLSEAAKTAKVQPSLLRQLIDWGDERHTGGDLTAFAPETQRDTSIRQANEITAGLLMAHQKGQIKYGSLRYKQVQTAIRELRRGKTLEEAARTSKVPMSVLKQLLGSFQSFQLSRDFQSE